MTPERWQLIRTVFTEARQQAPGNRKTFLAMACADDPALQAEVWSLLQAAEDTSAVDDLAQAWVSPLLLGLRDHLEVGTRVGPYEIVGELGRGGMGVVYRAWDPRLGRDLALKLLPPSLGAQPDAKARFLAEAQAASVLDHANICTIYEADEAEDGRLYIAMAFYEGQTLKERLREGPLPVEESISLALQAAEGLHAAHNAGIVHRDIKPANLIVTSQGTLKILDFGIAKLQRASDLTRPGTKLGTVAYMAPEQVRGETVDGRADLWALGVVLYEMLTGTQPFTGGYEQAVFQAILHDVPEPVQTRRREVPEGLAQVLDRALQKAPDARYASMSALIKDLRRLQQGILPAPLTAGTKPRKHRPALLALAAVILVLLSMGVWQWFDRGGVREQPAAVTAAEMSIGVMYFDNLTSDASLDWIEAALVEMLTANLGQFENVEVLSSQRLFDIMQQVSEEDAAQIDRRTATEVARRAGVRIMLLGSVLGSQEHLRLNTQLVAAATGDLVGTEVVDAGPGGSLFTLVDSLTQRLATRLEIHPPGQSTEAHVAYTLTSSPEALRQYVEGLQAMYRSNFTEAIKQFNAAVATDSTFVMAYYHRELAYSWQTGSADREALERALQYADRLSERERTLIEATLTMLEDLPTRKETFEQLTERYPDEKFAWYQLGEILYHNYWPRTSVDVFSRAVELDPHFLIAYTHLTDFYFHTDEYDKARLSLNKGLSLDASNIEFKLSQAYLDFFTSGDEQARDTLMELLEQVAKDTTLNLFSRLDAEAALTMMTKDFARMDISLHAFRRGGHYGDEGYVLATNSLAGLALLRGDVTQAERYLREAREKHPDSPSQLYEEGLFWLLQEKPDAARANARKILNLHDNGSEPFTEVATVGWHLLFQVHLAKADVNAAQQALSALERLKADRQNEYGFLYDDAMGRMACAEGNTDVALQHYARARTAISFTGTHTGVVLLFHKLLLDAQLECLEQEGAYETLLQRASEAPLFVYHFHDYNASTMVVWLRTLLRQAHAYEALGQIPQAMDTYEKFLTFWNDPKLIGVREARARLAQLKNQI